MRRRRLLIGGAVGGGLLLLAVVAFFLFYGRIAAWAVKTRVLPKVRARLDRSVAVGTIDVDRERVVMTDVVVTGPADDGEPLARVAKVTVEYEFWDALFGDLQVGVVTIDGLAVNVARGQDGADNVSDLVDRILGRDRGDGGGKRGGGGMRLRPKRVVVTGASFRVVDDESGTSVSGVDISVDTVPGEPFVVTTGKLVATTNFGVTAGAAGLVVSADPEDPKNTARIEVEGGRLKPWRGMTLTGIAGTIEPEQGGERAVIDLRGGYGGVDGTLWTAAGWVEPASRNGSLDLKADRFEFSRLRPILEDSPLIDFDKTSANVNVAIRVEDGVGEFEGDIDLANLTVFHEKLAEVPVRDLSFSAGFAGGFDAAQRSISLTRGDVDYRGVKISVDAFAYLPGGMMEEVGMRRLEPRVGGHLKIPTLPCQEMLDAMPVELTPHLQGFKLRGKFYADVYIDIDFADLDATRLDGGVGIRRCKVKQAPKAMDAEKFIEPFEHSVPDIGEDWVSFEIGDENPYYVPIWDISPHIINSILTTEDSLFYNHKGFITKEFRTALVKNLKAGRFKYGASSITMQTVKNVMLNRDKLLARKLQELFLTWYIETVLEKDRIMEIYLNAIEYGPGIYGIGKATQHYFGKHPRDINAVEAAFFSSILPGPKPRYVQYCTNKLSRYTTNKMPRILKKMVERDRLPPEQLSLIESGLVKLEFVYPEDFSERDCKKEIELYMATPEQLEEMNYKPARRRRDRKRRTNSN